MLRSISFNSSWMAMVKFIKLKLKNIHSSNSRTDQDVVIKMFDHLKGQVHVANQNGLQSIQNF